MKTISASLVACMVTLLCIGAYFTPAEARSEAMAVTVQGRQVPGASAVPVASNTVALACDCPRKRDRFRNRSHWNVSVAACQPAYAPVVYQPVCYQPVYAAPVYYAAPAPVVYRARPARVVPAYAVPCCRPTSGFSWSFSFGR